MELQDRAQLAALRVAGRFTRHPLVHLKTLKLVHERDADLEAIGGRYGLRGATLQRMSDEGMDAPAFRFHRDALFYAYFAAHAESLRGCSWLDVGAGTGAVDVYLSEMLAPERVELCDIKLARKAAYPVRAIDGTGLDDATDGFDLVFFTYVLHHAADNAIALLRDAHRIARRHVVVLEDPKETEADYYWAYKHDRRATFRGRKEWREMFEMLDFEITYDAPLGNEIHSRHFFLLSPR